MAHARETVRKAIVAAITGLATTGSRVFSNYVYPFEDDDLPNVSLYVAQEPETVADDGEMGVHEFRNMPFQVAGRAKAVSDMSDTLDDICVEVETAIYANAALAGHVKDVRLVSTQVEMDSESEKPVGVVRMEWMALYRVDRTAPTAPVQ